MNTTLHAQIPTIQTLLLHLERKGNSKGYLKALAKGLKALAERADLANIEETELAIARYIKKNGEPCTSTYKAKLVSYYAHYLKHIGLTWQDKPKYKNDSKTVQPPTDEKCQMLIAGARGQLSLKLDISTQTGLRPCEVMSLRVKDIHPDQSTITADSAKGCNPRPPIKITRELTTRLQTHILRKELSPNNKLFKGNSDTYGSNYRAFRQRLARKLKDPTFLTIRLYDLRHHYITKLLRKTQNAEIVRQKIGHKRLNTTQRYLHLLADTSGEWIVESTTDQKRADELLKEDFNYVLTTPDGYMKFRKRK